MASIYIINKICKSLAPNTFIQATKNTDIIVGGISKFTIEHILLKYEMILYKGLLMSPLFITSSVDIHIDKPILVPFIVGSLITLPVIYSIPYCIPAYRTYNVIVNKNLQIINVDNSTDQT
jgi:hypothetical protein